MKVLFALTAKLPPHFTVPYSILTLYLLFIQKLMNFLLILLTSVTQFIVGALWYSPVLFGKICMNIMEAEHHSKEELAKMQKGMMPFYGLQFFLTVASSVFLFYFLREFTLVSALELALFVWALLIVPTQVSSVIWGNTKKSKWAKQIAITTGCSLVCYIIAAVFFAASV